MINKIWIDNLKKVLEYENKLYKQLLMIAEEKTGVVVKNELQNLQTMIGREQHLISELNKLKDAREQIMEQVAGSIGKDKGEITLTDIISILPKEQGGQLSGIREKLKETIAKLSDQNHMNQKLIQNALDYVDFSLNLLTQPAPQMPQYGSKGHETETKRRGVLDVKY